MKFKKVKANHGVVVDGEYRPVEIMVPEGVCYSIDSQDNITFSRQEWERVVEKILTADEHTKKDYRVVVESFEGDNTFSVSLTDNEYRGVKKIELFSENDNDKPHVIIDKME